MTAQMSANADVPASIALFFDLMIPRVVMAPIATVLRIFPTPRAVIIHAAERAKP